MIEAGVVEGRIVHFVRDGKCHAAIVVSQAEPGTNSAGLRVFSKTAKADDTVLPSVDYSQAPLESTWHWPLDHKAK